MKNVFYNPTLENRIYNILRRLSLSVDILAKILNVERHVIYQWKQGNVATLKREDYKRLLILSDIANSWPCYCNNGPIGIYLKKTTSLGVSTLDLLRQTPIDKEKLQLVFQEIAPYAYKSNERIRKTKAIKKQDPDRAEANSMHNDLMRYLNR